MTPGLRRGALILLAVLVVAACSDDDDGQATSPPTSATGPSASAGCDAARVAEPGTTDRTMTSGGTERSFRLIVPDGYDGSTPLPVVLTLHSLSIPNTIVSTIGGFGEIARQYDFITVAPLGQLDGPTPYWLAVPVEDNPDVAFISDLLDLVESELCVSRDRVLSTGQSNGGQMSSLLACELSDRISAIAPIAGVEAPTCDSPPVPIMAFHGDADPIVTFDGGGLNATAIATQNHFHGDVPSDLPRNPGVDEVLQQWAEHNGCDPGPTEEEVSPEVVHFTWDGCDAVTELYVVLGGGHTWPGRPIEGFDSFGPPATTDIHATQLMFELFLGPPAG